MRKQNDTKIYIIDKISYYTAATAAKVNDSSNLNVSREKLPHLIREYTINNRGPLGVDE